MQKFQMTGSQLLFMAAILGAGAIANAADEPTVPAANHSRPNIVYIMADYDRF